MDLTVNMTKFQRHVKIESESILQIHKLHNDRTSPNSLENWKHLLYESKNVEKKNTFSF